MKVNFTSDKSKLQLVAEGSPAEIWQELQTFQELFEDNACGKCNNKDIKYRIRKAEKGKKEYDYYELQCPKCYAKMSYGQSDEGALFPIRFLREGKEYVKDENGKNIPKGTRGWVKFNKETGKEE